MSTTDSQIGQNLVTLRGDMSQKDLATRMRTLGWKWSQATVWSVETGERPLRLAEATDLAQILNTHVSRLTGTEAGAALEQLSRQVQEAQQTLRTNLQTYRRAQFALASAADRALGKGVKLPHAGAMIESSLRTTPEDVLESMRRQQGRIDRENAILSQEAHEKTTLISDSLESRGVTVTQHPLPAERPFMQLLETMDAQHVEHSETS